MVRSCSLPLSVGLHKEEKGSDDIGRICVIKNLLLITHVTNKRAVINTSSITFNITWGRSQRLLQWGLSLSCLSSWSWSACSLHSVRQVSLSFIQTLRAGFKCSLRMWGSLDIYIVLLQLLLHYKNRVTRAVPKLTCSFFLGQRPSISSYRTLIISFLHFSTSFFGGTNSCFWASSCIFTSHCLTQ
jgi:hypothetical protein